MSLENWSKIELWENDGTGWYPYDVEHTDGKIWVGGEWAERSYEVLRHTEGTLTFLVDDEGENMEIVTKWKGAETREKPRTFLDYSVIEVSAGVAGETSYEFTTATIHGAVHFRHPGWPWRLEHPRQAGGGVLVLDPDTKVLRNTDTHLLIRYDILNEEEWVLWRPIPELKEFYVGVSSMIYNAWAKVTSDPPTTEQRIEICREAARAILLRHPHLVSR